MQCTYAALQTMQVSNSRVIKAAACPEQGFDILPHLILASIKCQAAVHPTHVILPGQSFYNEFIFFDQICQLLDMLVILNQ